MVESSKIYFVKQYRKSIRMKGYDYSLEGAYFITLVTYHRCCIFGEINNGIIVLSDFGKTALDQWMRLKNRFCDFDFPSFIIMPNHVHGIIVIVRGAGEKSNHDQIKKPPLRPYSRMVVIPGSLGAVVRAYKASVTYRINSMRRNTYPPVWQRNYYDHIIRNQKDYESIWNYIDSNPSNWIEDQLNPLTTQG